MLPTWIEWWDARTSGAPRSTRATVAAIVARVVHYQHVTSTIRVLLALLIPVGLIGIMSVGSLAIASCVQESFTEQARRADAVVYGRVVAMEGPPAGPPSRYAHVEVERVLKGSVPARIGVALGPGAERGTGPGAPVATSVDYTVQRGEDHTLYLKRYTPGGFSTDACAGSHAGPPTADETAFFGAGTTPERVPGGVDGANGSDRLIAAVATMVALVAGVAAIVYAQAAARRRAVI